MIQTIARYATRDQIIKHGKEANIFHYLGHANNTALILHAEEDIDDIEYFYFDDMFANLDVSNAYLATLSACETGIINPGKIDEYIGIPSAFLHAGAATVVSSLWTVSDISTSLLMGKMYEFIKDNDGKIGKAKALIKAQRWLKDPEKRQEHLEMLAEIDDIHWVSTQPPDESAPDFSKPYHWAGFICSGVD